MASRGIANERTRNLVVAHTGMLMAVGSRAKECRELVEAARDKEGPERDAALLRSTYMSGLIDAVAAYESIAEGGEVRDVLMGLVGKMDGFE